MNHKQRAIAAFELDRYETTIREASLAIVEDPEDDDNYRFLGQALFVLGREQEAIEALQTSIEKDPNWCMSHYILSHFFYQQQRYKEAQKAAEEAVRIEPNHAISQAHLANVYAHIPKKSKEARVAADLALALAPTEPFVLRLVGDFWLDHEESDDKKTLSWKSFLIFCSVALMLSLLLWNFVFFTMMLGLIVFCFTPFFLIREHQKKKIYHRNLHKAKDLYLQALGYRPQDAVSLNNLGCTLLRLEKKEDALATFQAALRIDPTMIEIQDNTHLSMKNMIGGLGKMGLLTLIIFKLSKLRFVWGLIIILRRPVFLIPSILVCILLFWWYRKVKLRRLKQKDPALLELFAKLEEDIQKRAKDSAP